MYIPSAAVFPWCCNFLTAMLIVACSSPLPSTAPVTSISAEDLHLVSNLRIFFGHQSVGANMIDGVQQLAEKAQVKLAITKSRRITSPGITHFNVGANGDPLAKIRDFSVAIMETASAQQPDIAMMKLCYVDINRNTDIRTLANNYVETTEQLRRQFPRTRFVSVTVPLTTPQTGPKAWVKRILGKNPSGYEENLRREEFNQILRDRYAGEGLVFDLAEVESQGSSAEFMGRRFKVLAPHLTSDGGHLNTTGRQIVASAWMHYLAELGRQQRP